jgi:hypothetical protein
MGDLRDADAVVEDAIARRIRDRLNLESALGQTG